MALYLEHFGLGEPPFRITPHTDFFFDGADRGATLEALVYAVLHDEGIVKVSGEVGSGKTMLCRVLMERLPAHVETLYIATPSLGHDEILHAIAAELELRRHGLPGIDPRLQRFDACCLHDAKAWAPRDFVARLDQLGGGDVLGRLFEAWHARHDFPPIEPLYRALGLRRDLQGFY
jgi:hypothetical protein